MIILAGVAFMATRRLELVPRGAQNAMEVVLEQIQGMIDDVMGPQGRPYLPFIAPSACSSSRQPHEPRARLAGPTTNLNTTAACALVVFFAYHAIGLRRQGVVTYIKHFMGPVWWLAPLMMPIEIISHLARPLSLTLRLFGNMVGGHILLAVIFFLMGLNGLIGWALHGGLAGALVGGLSGVIAIVFTVGFLYPLKMLVSFLQAFIFVMLTMLYIAGAIEHAEEGHDGHAAAHHDSGHH